MNQTLNEIGKEIIEDFKKYETGEKWGDLDQWLSKALAKHAIAVRESVTSEILGELEKHGHPMQGTWRRLLFQLRQRYLGGGEGKK